MPNGSLSLAAKLYLLAWDPRTGRPADPDHLPYLVRAGALTELAQRGMLADEDGVARPFADARTGDPALDSLLELIFESRPRAWQTWVRHHARLTERAVRDQLVTVGYVRAKGRRALGLLPVKEYELERPDVVAGMREDAVRLLRGGQRVSEVSAGDAALVALAAAGELRTVVTAADARAHKARIAELARRSGQVGPALEKALGQVRSAVAVAVTGVTLSGTLAAAG
ncbi:hypothetical protein SBI_02654 [Streptomyces bingchenggensis BCW-1]|uniref:Uncharacterized protein n=1 Tax=Streptomyces bingchenggensis (strain BCW-1) TaxID=749414 RepID=D7C0Q3_STRBB|nr:MULTISPECIES: GPP34 family phosphoprotein [Streptomyces]ADI05775.1 hypothetical protein SBI_02654 [Streptomyces bingchenggensis BCW-1]